MGHHAKPTHLLCISILFLVGLITAGSTSHGANIAFDEEHNCVSIVQDGPGLLTPAYATIEEQESTDWVAMYLAANPIALPTPDVELAYATSPLDLFPTLESELQAMVRAISEETALLADESTALETVTSAPEPVRLQTVAPQWLPGTPAYMSPLPAEIVETTPAIPLPIIEQKLAEVAGPETLEAEQHYSLGAALDLLIATHNAPSTEFSSAPIVETELVETTDADAGPMGPVAIDFDALFMDVQWKLEAMTMQLQSQWRSSQRLVNKVLAVATDSMPVAVRDVIAAVRPREDSGTTIQPLDLTPRVKPIPIPVFDITLP